MDLLLFKDLYLDHISVEKNASTNTLEAYARDLDKCVVFLSDEESLSSPRDVRLIHLARFFQSLSKAGLAASSQARAQSAVRQLFKWGAKRGHIDADPSRAYSHRRYHGVYQPCSAEQVLDLIAAASTAHTGTNRYLAPAAMELLYASGLRASELCRLRLEELHLELGVVRPRGKVARNGWFPLVNMRKKLSPIISNMRALNY